MTQPPGGLGRGLSALLPAEREQGARLREIPLEQITPNPRQPRATFDEAALEELAASIRAVGLLQPIVVRPAGEGFELVAGERRWRAARRAGLERVPALVRDTADEHLLRDALVENLQREDLDPLEEAAAYRQLVDELGVTHEEIATRVGKSRAAITNALRLLSLAPEVQSRLKAGLLSGAHARALAALADAGAQARAAERVVADGLSVRQTEELVRTMAGAGASLSERAASSRRRESVRSAGALEVEALLSDILATRVTVEEGRARGRLVIEFAGSEDLDRIVQRIAEAREG